VKLITSQPHWFYTRILRVPKCFSPQAFSLTPKSAHNLGATHSFITPYSFSCMALRRWESSTLIAAVQTLLLSESQTLIAAFLLGQESAATKLLAPTKLSAPFDWPPQSLS
jgi:hypothetical protein